VPTVAEGVADGLAVARLVLPAGAGDGLPVPPEGALRAGAAVADGPVGGMAVALPAWPGGTAADAACTALTIGMPDPGSAFLSTTFAPNDATRTAITVPATQAARPATTRIMSAIMPHAVAYISTVHIMARVLIVEDDPFVRSAMAADLGRSAHAVRTVGTALDGIREVTHHQPEVIVLDLGLPDLDGGQALKMIRTITATPVLIATARDEEAEIIRLLNAGADDYIVKPFSGEHLAARVAALLRRSGQQAAAHVLSAGGLNVDLARREAYLDGTQLDLSRREFDLLAYLAARPGQVVTRRELRTEVWHQSYGDDQTIDVHVSWLRRKLGETATRPRYLHTVRGVGVKLDPTR
jgi:DNA-binding response OmpR family regulator